MKAKNSWILRSLLVLLAVTALVLGSVGTVHAAEINDDGTLPAGTTVDDDLIIGGDNVTIDGTVNGILFAGGDTVTLNGTVNGDAMLFGQTIIVSETAVIKGNLFVGGSVIEVNGTVEGSILGGSSSLTLEKNASVASNVYLGGYNIEMVEGSTITRDLFVGGYQVVLGGAVERDVNIASAAAEINGVIGRNANLDVEAPGGAEFNFYPVPGVTESLPTGLRISDSAQIGGKLTYTSSADQSSSIQVQPEGGVVYQTPVPQPTPQSNDYSYMDRSYRSGFSSLRWLRNTGSALISLLFIGALAFWLAPRAVRSSLKELKARPWHSLGYGFLAVVIGAFALIMLPIAFVLLGIMLVIISLGGLVGFWFFVVGAALTFAAVAFLFLVFTGSQIVVAYFIGEWLVQKIAPASAEKPFWPAVTGLVVVALVCSLPFIGWLLGLLIDLFGLGAICIAIANRMKGNKVEAAPIAPVAETPVQ